MFVKSDSIVGRGKRDKLLDFAIFQVAMVPISRLGCLSLHEQHWSKVTMFCKTSTVQVYFPHHEWIYLQAKTLQFLPNFFFHFRAVHNFPPLYNLLPKISIFIDIVCLFMSVGQETKRRIAA